MKGTALVTTTVTVKPAYVTEVREAEVLGANQYVVTVRGKDGVKRFKQDELDALNVNITVNGKPARVIDLKAGDKLTATLISRTAPEVLTEKQVQAVLAEPAALKPAPVTAAEPAAPAATAAAAPAKEATTGEAAAAPATEAPAAAAVAAEPAVAEVAPAGRSFAWLYWLLALVVVAILAKLLFGNKNRKS
jgi:predicted regulator of Ras-like GTPase activity (Roadblock/LC7/MglB family)